LGVGSSIVDPWLARAHGRGDSRSGRVARPLVGRGARETPGDAGAVSLSRTSTVRDRGGRDRSAIAGGRYVSSNRRGRSRSPGRPERGRGIRWWAGGWRHGPPRDG